MPAVQLLMINIFSNDTFVYNYYNPDYPSNPNYPYNPDPNDPNKPDPIPSPDYKPNGSNKNAVFEYYYDRENEVNYLDSVEFPDSYFTMSSVGCEFNMLIDDEITGPISDSVMNSCFPAYETVETGADDIAAATSIINRETDSLNGVISYAMILANASNSPRKKISTDAVYGIATSSKLIISNATNTFNNNTADAKQKLNTGIAAAAANAKTQIEFKEIDKPLLKLYVKVVRFLENGIGKGRSPVTVIDPVTKKRTAAAGEYSNRAYKDSVGVWTIGIGHTDDITYPNLIYNGRTINVGPTGPGITDDEVEDIFLGDLNAKIKDLQNYLGANKWNYLYDNDQCMLILLIDIQYNTSGLRNKKWGPLLYGNGLSRGIGSGLGLGDSSFLQLLNLSISPKPIYKGKPYSPYNYTLWTTDGTMTAPNYKIEKQNEISQIVDATRPKAGKQRNDAITQIFIDKNKFSSFTYIDKNGNSTPPINYWNKFNKNSSGADIINLSSYVHTQ